jgi:hypothetical protein
MKTRIAVSIATGVVALIWCAGAQQADAQVTDPASAPSLRSGSEQNLVLTQAQRRAIYAAATRDRIKRPQR